MRRGHAVETDLDATPAQLAPGLSVAVGLAIARAGVADLVDELSVAQVARRGVRLRRASLVVVGPPSVRHTGSTP